MADQGMAGYYYDDIVRELGARPVFTRATLRAVSANSGTVTLPAEAIEVFYVFYDDRLLPPATLRQLEAVDPQWRDRRGTPQAYTMEQEDDRTLRLFPVPDISSKAQSFAFGEPFGRDFPEAGVTLVHTEDRELPDYLDLPAALEILAREMARESDHRDLEFAGLARQLADVTMLMALGDRKSVV